MDIRRTLWRLDDFTAGLQVVGIEALAAGLSGWRWRESDRRWVADCVSSSNSGQLASVHMHQLLGQLALVLVGEVGGLYDGVVTDSAILGVCHFDELLEDASGTRVRWHQDVWQGHDSSHGLLTLLLLLIHQCVVA